MRIHWIVALLALAARVSHAAVGDAFSFLTAPGWERVHITFQRDANGQMAGFSMIDGTNPAPQLFTKFKA